MRHFLVQTWKRLQRYNVNPQMLAASPWLQTVGAFQTWHNSYTVTLQDDEGDDTLAWIVNRLVDAERLILPQGTNFSRVLALLADDSGAFNPYTPAHSFFLRSNGSPVTWSHLLAIRPDFNVVPRTGVLMLMQRKEGAPHQNYYAGAYTYADVGTSAGGRAQRRTFHLGGDGPFMGFWARFYSAIWEGLPQVNAGHLVSNAGAVKATAARDGVPVPNSPMLANGLARVAANRTTAQDQVDSALEIAQIQAERGAEFYDRVMEKFNHQWGDAYFPDFRGPLCLDFTDRAVSLWRFLAKAWRMTVPNHLGDPWPLTLPFDTSPTPGPNDLTNVLPGKSAALAYSCVAELWRLDAWQQAYLKTFVWPSPFAYLAWKGKRRVFSDAELATVAAQQARVTALYNLFDNIGRYVFGAVNVLSVLRATLDTKRRYKAVPSVRIKTVASAPDTHKHILPTAFNAFSANFEEFHTRKRDPYLRLHLEPLPQVAIHIPQAPKQPDPWTFTKTTPAPENASIFQANTRQQANTTKQKEVRYYADRDTDWDYVPNSRGVKFDEYGHMYRDTPFTEKSGDPQPATAGETNF